MYHTTLGIKKNVCTPLVAALTMLHTTYVFLHNFNLQTLNLFESACLTLYGLLKV